MSRRDPKSVTTDSDKGPKFSEVLRDSERHKSFEVPHLPPSVDDGVFTRPWEIETTV